MGTVHPVCFFLLLTVALFITCLPSAHSLETDSCQVLSSADTYYSLNKSVNVNGTCFSITADNITLDCAGYNLTGNHSGYAVNITEVDNITVKNCMIYDFYTGIGKVDYSVTYNIVIMNNTINISTHGSLDYGDGIQIVSAVNASITNNTVTTWGNQSHAIGFNPGINSSLVAYNAVTTYGNSSFGIFPSLSYYNNISYNTITVYGDDCDGIDSPSSFWNHFDYNNVTVHYSGGGIHIVYNSSHNVIAGNIVTLLGSDSPALEVAEVATNNTFSDNIVTALNDNIGLEISHESYENVIRDSVFNVPDFNDVVLDDAGENNIFLNVTFDVDEIEFESPFTGTVILQWYADVTVRDPDNSLSSGANVSVYNDEGDASGSQLTDSSGSVRFELVEYWQNATMRIYSTPHTINVSKPAFSNETQTINMTENAALNFQLLQFLGSCGQTITNSTALNQNLNCTGVGIQIDGHNVTLDCKGFNITGNDTNDGINAYDVDNITVRNCNVYRFGPAGIYYFNSSFGTVENCNVFNSSTGHGIVMSHGSSNNTVRGNTAFDNYLAGFIPIENTSAYNWFINNTAAGNMDHGMEIENGAHHNYFINNIVNNNTYTGIKLSPDTHNNTIRGNVINGTDNQGINIDNSSCNVIEDNYILDTPSEAIRLDPNSTMNLIAGNTIESCQAGVNFVYADYSNATGNTVDGCENGIMIQNSTGTVVAGNSFSGITNEEFFIDGNATNVTVFDNVFTSRDLVELDIVITWDNGSVGNRWKSYDQPSEGCEDANSNGICDSPYSIGEGNIDSLPIALVTGAVTQDNNGGSSTRSSSTSAAAVPGCVTDDDCNTSSQCMEGECIEIICICGTISNHSCVQYECCSKTQCLENQTCIDNACVHAEKDDGSLNETKEFIDYVEGLLENSDESGNVALEEARRLLGDANIAFEEGNFLLARNLSQNALDIITGIEKGDEDDIIDYNAVLYITFVAFIFMAAFLLILKIRHFKLKK